MGQNPIYSPPSPVIAKSLDPWAVGIASRPTGSTYTLMNSLHHEPDKDNFPAFPSVPWSQACLYTRVPHVPYLGIPFHSVHGMIPFSPIPTSPITLYLYSQQPSLHGFYTPNISFC